MKRIKEKLKYLNKVFDAYPFLLTKLVGLLGKLILESLSIGFSKLGLKLVLSAGFNAWFKTFVLSDLINLLSAVNFISLLYGLNGFDFLLVLGRSVISKVLELPLETFKL